MASERRRRGTLSSEDQSAERRRGSVHIRSSDDSEAYSQNSLAADQSSTSTQSLAHEQHRRRQQPLSEAVNDAFDHSDVASRVDPDLVAVITSQVIQNLKLSGFGSGSNSPPKPVPNVVAQPTPLNSSSTPVPPRDVYTPPSPSLDEPHSLNSLGSDRPASPIAASHDATFDGHMDERFTTRPGPAPLNSSRNQSRPRPAAPPRHSTGDATTLEKIWQPLFSPDGLPTARLGQFLRGLALHIIEDYEPTFSLVITPHKMAKFYQVVRLPNEVYPWSSIFGGKVTNSSLSHLYRDLKCQHHFVQSGADDKPTIPGLTPPGFECWMTHVIRAHPDLEFDRFAKAVLDMPISNSDDRRERFPKQLSRRLFPASANGKIREHLEDSILADPVVDLIRIATPIALNAAQKHSSKSFQQPTEPTLPQEQTRRKTPPPPPTHETADLESPPAVALERERKPYYAQPGGGKVSADVPKPDLRPQRSNTTSSSTTHRTTFDTSDDGPTHSRFRSDSVAATAAAAPRGGGTSQRRHSPEKSEFSNRSSAADPSHYTHRASVYESDDESYRLSKQQSREQRARQHILESTEPRSTEPDHDRPRGNSTSTGQTYYPPPPQSRYV